MTWEFITTINQLVEQKRWRSKQNEKKNLLTRKKKIFDFIDDLLQKTGKVGEYDQKI